MGKMGKMMLAIALSLPVGVLAQEPVPPGQQQDQAINSTINPAIDVAPVGSGNVTDTNTAVDVKTTIIKNEADIPVHSAYAPTVVPGQCQRAIAVAFQFAGAGFSAGGTKELDSCLARELAILMGETKDTDLVKNAKVIWDNEFFDYLAERKLKMQPKGIAYVCKQPFDEHCTVVKSLEPEEPGE